MSIEQAAVIGDVHGQLDLLTALIAEIDSRLPQGSPIYQLGDMIDRGPQSNGVIQLCIDRKVKGVRGNHEEWLRGFCTTHKVDSFALHPAMRGDATLISYGATSLNYNRELKANLPKSHRDHLKALPMFRIIQVGGKTFYLSHAGFTTDLVEEVPDYASLSAHEICEAVSQGNTDAMLWTSPNLSPPNLYQFPEGGIQIFGHTPQRAPRFGDGWVAMDTGCGTCAPFSLSAILLPSMETLTVNHLSLKGVVEGGFTSFNM